MQLNDLTGKRFGRLIVNGRALGRADKQTYWNCTCDCGSSHVVNGRHLKSGEVGSCGCLMREMTLAGRHRTHGKSRTPTYNCWAAMISRCGNPNNQDYADYGGRGISVCDRWLSFENFLTDMGEKPVGRYSIDRRRNSEGYKPGNCRWATPVEQSNNRRSSRIVIWDGASQTLAELVRAKGASYSRTMNRIRSGWSLEAAICTPPDLNKVNTGVRS